MFASDVTYLELLIRGLLGLLIPTLLSGLGYFAADRIAHAINSKSWMIYASRLVFVAGFTLLWWFCYGNFVLRASAGNQLLADVYYRMALHEGVGYGMHSIWAWCVVALIDWPRRAQAGQTEPNQTSQATGAPRLDCERSLTT